MEKNQFPQNKQQHRGNAPEVFGDIRDQFEPLALCRVLAAVRAREDAGGAETQAGPASGQTAEEVP